MKKIKKLTPEQVAKFPEYVKKWTEIGLCTKPANRAEAEAGIVKAYAAAGLSAPKIVWTTSPLANGLTRSVLQSKDFEKVFNKKVWDSVGDSVRASVWDSVWASVGASVWDSVWASVGASVWDSVWASVGASVRASVGDSVRASVGDSVRASVWDSGYGQHDANWIGFYDFFRTELGLTNQTDLLQGLQEITENAGWFLPHEKICWVSERHTILRTDDRGRLHSETGAALEYPDGFGIFSWHGTKIPEEWILQKEKLTPEIALTWQNVEQRRAACEILGWANVLEHPSLNPKIIDTDEPHIGELIQVDLPDAKAQWFLKYQCGTGRWFAEAVNDKIFNTALKANAGGNGWRGVGDPESFIPFLRT